MGNTDSLLTIFDSSGSVANDGHRGLNQHERNVLNALLEKPDRASGTFEGYLTRYLLCKDDDSTDKVIPPEQRLSQLLYGDNSSQADAVYFVWIHGARDKHTATLRTFVADMCKQAIDEFWQLPANSLVETDEWMTDWCLTEPSDVILQLYGVSADTLEFSNGGERRNITAKCLHKWTGVASQPNGVDLDLWRKWWQGCSVFKEIINMVISHALYSDSRAIIRGAVNDRVHCPSIPEDMLNAPFQYLLTPAIGWALGRELPKESQKSWSCIYSSMRDGLSWSTFQSRIERSGSILLLVREKQHPYLDGDGESKCRPNQQRVFGAYFDGDLERNPSWRGNSLNFVFSITTGGSRLGLDVYRTTGFNANYQYFNYATKTLPNGLGAGGQLEHFGLWIDGSFTCGSSNSAATFGSEQLSTQRDFEIDVIEAWLVRPTDRLDDDGPGGAKKQSVLDANPEAAALLELANRKMYSKALPDPTLDRDDKHH